MKAALRPFYGGFGAKLRAARKRARLTQMRLGRIAGLSWYAIGRLERGESEITVPLYLHLCACLGVTPSALMPETRARPAVGMAGGHRPG